MAKTEKWFKSEKTRLFLLVILSAAVRIFFLLNYESMPENATESVVRALSIIENPSFALNFNGNYSIFFNYAIASFMFFWHDPFLAPRVFTLIFGVLLVFPYYGVLKILFDRRIAFFSSFVLVFYPLHIIQSGTATVEAVFYFFLFASFYYFFKFRNGQGQKSALWLSVLLFNMASLMRLESWLFIPLFFFLLWPKGKGTAFQFLILSMVFPCLWLLLNQVTYQNFLLTFKNAAITANKEIAGGTVSYDPGVFSWLVVLWRSSGPSLVIGGLLGVLFSFLSRKKFELALFFLALLLTLTINSCATRMWHNERYSIVLGLLLIPYAWFFVDKALTFLDGSKKLFFLLFLIFPAIDTWQIIQKPNTTMPHMLNLMTEDINNVARWLKKNVRQNETLIIGADRFDVFSSYIMLRGEITPSTRCLTVRNAEPVPFFKSKEEFERCIWFGRPKYLVLNSESDLQKVLNFKLDQKKQRLGDISFEVAFEQDGAGFGKYIIYRISYPESSGGGEDA